MLDYVILRYNFIIKGRLWNNYDLPSPNLNEPNLTFTSSPAARSAYAMAARALPKSIRCLWCCLPITISQWSGIMIPDWWFNFVRSDLGHIAHSARSLKMMRSLFAIHIMVWWTPLESGDRGKICLVGAWGSVASATICFEPPSIVLIVFLQRWESTSF